MKDAVTIEDEDVCLKVFVHSAEKPKPDFAERYHEKQKLIKKTEKRTE